jgi:hypothetical protein
LDRIPLYTEMEVNNAVGCDAHRMTDTDVLPLTLPGPVFDDSGEYTPERSLLRGKLYQDKRHKKSRTLIKKIKGFFLNVLCTTPPGQGPLLPSSAAHHFHSKHKPISSISNKPDKIEKPNEARCQM